MEQEKCPLKGKKRAYVHNLPLASKIKWIKIKCDKKLSIYLINHNLKQLMMNNISAHFYLLIKE